MNPLSKLFYPLIKNGWVDGWTSVHMFLAGLFAWALQWFIGSSAVIYIVLTIAILFETWQYSQDGSTPYGSAVRWLRNTIMDILCAVFMAVVVVWHG